MRAPSSRREPGAAPTCSRITAKRVLPPSRKPIPACRRRSTTPMPISPNWLVEHAELVIVHEWNEPELIARLGTIRKRGAPFRLLFHDTHHRAVSAPEEMRAYDLSGLTACSPLAKHWPRSIAAGAGAMTYTSGTRPPTCAASTRRRRKAPAKVSCGSAIGAMANAPPSSPEFPAGAGTVSRARAGHLRRALSAVRRWRRWSATAPAIAAGRPTRSAPDDLRAPSWRPSTSPAGTTPKRLPGIPTIRVFEALACGIPLLCAPWDDAEGLFRPGTDYLIARDGAQMSAHLEALSLDPAMRADLATNGFETIRTRHTCAHRVRRIVGASLDRAGARTLD
jgi:hypothetical protein